MSECLSKCIKYKTYILYWILKCHTFIKVYNIYNVCSVFNVTPYNIDSVYKDGSAKEFMPQSPSGRLSFFMICLSVIVSSNCKSKKKVLYKTVLYKTFYSKSNYICEWKCILLRLIK